MGSNVEKTPVGSGKAHNDIIKTPLYSNGTPEMDISRPVTTDVEGPMKPPKANMNYATELDVK